MLYFYEIIFYEKSRLKIGLGVIDQILGCIGIKMLLMNLYKIPIGFSLSVIVTVLIAAIFASMRRQRTINTRRN